MHNYRKITDISFVTDVIRYVEKTIIKTPIRYHTDNIGNADISR